MDLNLVKREISVKLVYYGPALSGKTTNLQAIHYYIGGKTDLLSLDTENDRTLFFDLLPLEFKSENGFTIKIKVFTVPGQAIHTSTRKMVLKGADGVVFVADSQNNQKKENNQSYKDLLANITFNNIEGIPIIVQFNKRDLDDIITEDEIAIFSQRAKVETTEAVAIKGKGVLDTFCLLIEKSYDYLDIKYSFYESFKITKKNLLENVFISVKNG